MRFVFKIIISPSKFKIGNAKIRLNQQERDIYAIHCQIQNLLKYIKGTLLDAKWYPAAIATALPSLNFMIINSYHFLQNYISIYYNIF